MSPAYTAPLTSQRPVLSRLSRRRGDSASPGRPPAALRSGAPAVPAGAREGRGDALGQRGPRAAGEFSRSPQPTARSPTARSPPEEQEICLAGSGRLQRWARSPALAPAPRRGRGPGAARGDGDAWCLALGAHRGRPPSWGCGLFTARTQARALSVAPLSWSSAWTQGTVEGAKG